MSQLRSASAHRAQNEYGAPVANAAFRKALKRFLAHVIVERLTQVQALCVLANRLVRAFQL